MLGRELLAACGIDSLEELSRRCVVARQAVGQPMERWSPQCLAMAIRLDVTIRACRPPPSSFAQGGSPSRTVTDTEEVTIRLAQPLG